MLDYDLWNSFDQIVKRTMNMMTKKDERDGDTDYFVKPRPIFTILNMQN
jgi:hypothetical protein